MVKNTQAIMGDSPMITFSSSSYQSASIVHVIRE